MEVSLERQSSCLLVHQGKQFQAPVSGAFSQSIRSFPSACLLPAQALSFLLGVQPEPPNDLSTLLPALLQSVLSTASEYFFSLKQYFEKNSSAASHCMYDKIQARIVAFKLLLDLAHIYFSRDILSLFPAQSSIHTATLTFHGYTGSSCHSGVLPMGAFAENYLLPPAAPNSLPRWLLCIFKP